jgi:glycosyltransferase involved in cell wall biosynthesis
MKKAKIKVMFPVNYMGIGGAEQQLLELVKGIDKEHFEPIVVTLYPGGPLDNEIKNIQGASLISVNRRGKYDFWTIFKILELLRKKEVDVIQPFLIPASFYGLLAALLGRTPVKILTERGAFRPNIGYGFRLYQKIQDSLTRFADWVVSNSEAGKSYLISRGINPARIKVIYNGINLSRLVPDPAKVARLREQLKLPEHGMLVGMTANFDPDKDYMTFLRGARIIHTAMPHTRFAILGDGPLRSEIENLAKELDMESLVTFFGHQRDVASHISCFDVACLCSTHGEGCSNVILESMGIGKAVVASDIAGNRELIENGHNGLLFSNRDPQDFAKAVLSLLRQPDRAREMGERAKHTVLNKFTIPRMVNEYEQLYEYSLERSS